MEESDNIAAVAVIDLSEGTAMSSLPAMTRILRQTPHSFHSHEEAIAWSLQRGSERSREANRVAIPSRLQRSDSGALEWRTNLFSTRDFWVDWFKGFSDDFANLRTARLLILAETDRLDKPLTIAQMQGRFQLEVLPGSGHEVHENNHKAVERILREFVARNKQFRSDIF
ncbi:Protein phosphatase methylesterase 1 [Bonamia ostreae]|uniref:protein phosphatase methylesterase-1 n=1 Tax=Bonamia ostreae TaxID=126728 RepID=A0ABV2AJ07_9EUKA